MDEDQNKDNNANGGADNQDQNQPTTVTLTQSELDAKIQSETDRKVSKALETSKAKIRDELLKEIEAEKAEAQKLSKLSAEEKARLELEKEREAIRKEREALEQEKLLNETGKQLGAKNLPVEFASYLVGKDAETTLANINQFDELWQKAIEKEVNAKLGAGFTPKASTSANVGVTIEEFRKMGYTAREKLAKENPEGYKALVLQEKSL